MQQINGAGCQPLDGMSLIHLQLNYVGKQCFGRCKVFLQDGAVPVAIPMQLMPLENDKYLACSLACDHLTSVDRRGLHWPASAHHISPTGHRGPRGIDEPALPALPEPCTGLHQLPPMLTRSVQPGYAHNLWSTPEPPKRLVISSASTSAKRLIQILHTSASLSGAGRSRYARNAVRWLDQCRSVRSRAVRT